MPDILVFDTNPVSRRFLAALLRNHGHKVRDAGDAAEALVAVRAERPDLMIVDITAPDMDGCRFVVRMRCEPTLPQPRVLMRAVAGVESLARESSRATRCGQSVAVILFDVDRFREFNDTLGQAAGDAILRSIGQCMVSLTRGEDLVARYGGDEFALMMANAPRGIVTQRADQIRQRARSLEIGCNDQQLGPVTLSVGIAVFPEHGDSTQALLKAADEALIRSKHAGRKRVDLEKATA